MRDGQKLAGQTDELDVGKEILGRATSVIMKDCDCHNRF